MAPRGAVGLRAGPRTWPVRSETVYLLGGATAGASLAFPNAKYSVPAIALVVVCVAFVVGGVLAVRLLNRASARTFKLIVAFGTLLAAAGVYEGGRPVQRGSVLLPLGHPRTRSPFFSTRQAAFQTALMAASYAVVLAVQLHQHPALGPGGLADRHVAHRGHHCRHRWHARPPAQPVVAGCRPAVPSEFRGLADRRRLRVHRPHLARGQRRALPGCSAGRGKSSSDIRLSTSRILPTSSVSRSVHEQLATEATVEFEKRYLRPDGSVVWAAVSDVASSCRRWASPTTSPSSATSPSTSGTARRSSTRPRTTP